MIITFYTAKIFYIPFRAIIKGFDNKLYSITNNKIRQIRVTFMELLQKFNVQLVKTHEKYVNYYLNLNKAVPIKFPGDFFIINDDYNDYLYWTC